MSIDGEVGEECQQEIDVECGEWMVEIDVIIYVVRWPTMEAR